MVAPVPDQLHNTQAELHARARAEFDLADFYKPRDDTVGEQVDSQQRTKVATEEPSPAKDTDLLSALAPLIVQEVRESAEAQSRGRRFGAIVPDVDGAPQVDVARPTVYAAMSTVNIAGVQHDQVLYAWWRPPTATDPPATLPTPMAVRITLDMDGFPLVWQLLGHGYVLPGQELYLFYVSTTLERRAGEFFGDPLPGRRYAIEQGADRRPDTIVVNVIDDGPIPMGPYVYIDAPNGRITSILCRCMASQVDAFVTEGWYELRSLAELTGFPLDLTPLGLEEIPGVPAEGIPSRAPRSPEGLAQHLRWPPANNP